jgi:hypothetical protein
MNAFILLLFIGVLVYSWLASLRISDIARHTASTACNRQGLQLLDGTVALQAIRPYWRNINDFGLQRTYVFDYSGDGISRQSGCVIMQNNRVTSVVLEQPPAAGPGDAPAPPDEPA